VICPKCGENNADTFRFCGMCGAVLARTMPASATRSEPAREGGVPTTLSIPANPARAGGERRVEAIGGPSVLGLGEPSLDSLREKPITSTGTIFEPERPKTGGRKLLLLVLLAALGAAVWWTYTNYIAIGESEKQEAASQGGTSAVPAEKPATTPTLETKRPDAVQPNASPAAATPSPAAAEKPPAQASVNPESKPEAAAQPRAHEKTVIAAAIAKPPQHATKHDGRLAIAAPKPAAAVVAADNGDAAFRRGEAYLYGRGVPQNCDEAIKYLKAASAKLHPRARSTFGTMYATGHCVPRDLPTSYLWFAHALQADPNNQVLVKDLNAIWNQMTPPERQLATKMRQ